jgi:large subunit ribosomal protein L15
MLDRLTPRPGAVREKKRVGRGPGSGMGKTSTRGEKGQGKRSAGRETPFWFEGGQMPLARRLPKRGFHNLFRKTYRVVNVGALSVFDEGTRVDVELLEKKGLVRHSKDPVKVLGNGDAPKGITLVVSGISAGARAKIEQAGGTVEIV